MSATVSAAHFALAAEAVTGGSPLERDVVQRVAQALADAEASGREELLPLLRDVVLGVELVDTGKTETRLETRVPKGTFARIAAAVKP